MLELLLQKSIKAFEIDVRYALSVVPGLFYGTILWWSQHRQRFKPRFRRLWIGCIALSVSLTIITSSQGAFYFLIPDFCRPVVVYVSLNRQWEHVGHIRTLMNFIPSQASVSATIFLLPHLSSRWEIVDLTNNSLPAIMLRNDRGEEIEVEYILADLWHLQRYQVAWKPAQRRLQALVPLIDQLLAQKKYGILGVQDGVILLQKATASKPQTMIDWLKLRSALMSILSDANTK